MDFRIFFAAPRRSGVEKNHAPPQGGVDWGGATEKSQSNFECLGWSGVEWIFGNFKMLPAGPGWTLAWF